MGSRGHGDDRAGGSCTSQSQTRSGRQRAVRSGEGGPSVLGELGIRPLPRSPSWVHSRWGGHLCKAGSGPLSGTRRCLWATVRPGAGGPGGGRVLGTRPSSRRLVAASPRSSRHATQSRFQRVKATPLCGQRHGPCGRIAPRSCPETSAVTATLRQPHGPRQTSCLHGFASSQCFPHTSHTARGFCVWLLVPCATHPELVHPVAC